MRDPRLLDHTDWKSKKGLHVLRSPDFTENTGEEQKKVFVARVEAPHFLRGPIGFSLLSQFVNPAQRVDLQITSKKVQGSFFGCGSLRVS